ncbi:MAG: DNA polymerase/3'-5' exonuclease PolX [Dethiobacteria bacterium]|nr:DNA polymerase/3'-5' exonuclease PolX [Dethiobacteria bacterium]
MHGAAKVLEEIAVLLELKGENPFKNRAYYGAARIVEMIGEEELERLVRADKLKEVKGIGAAIDEKLKELVLTGSLPYYDELKESVPAGLMDMLKVPGLGPRKVRSLFEMLEITTLAELEYACRENRLVKLKGFGQKSQDNILEGIEFLRRYQGSHFFSEARLIATDLLEKVKAFPDLNEVSLAGSIRRCREVVKDIDLVASAPDPQQLTRYFSELPTTAEVIALGDTKVSVRLQEGISVDLRVVRPPEFPYALHHFTGSKEHNTALRSRAKQMGLKINEYGLFRDEELIVCRDEKEFFAALNLVYIPPELRENNGEIEAAEAGSPALPVLVEPADIRGIFHVHSTYSDGANTLEELVIACRHLGYQYLGITDHSQSAFYAGGLKADDLVRQREEIAALREKYPDIGLYCGVESDIRPDGELDYHDSVLEKLDFVIASVHSALRMERSKMTERLLRALSHPLVTMLGHPTNRLLLGRDGSPIDLERIFEAAAENGVILELNASPPRLDLDWRHLKRVRAMNLPVSINPDAHRIESLSDTDFGVAIARKGWLEKKDVFNTRSRLEVETHLRSRNSRALQ